MFPIQDSVPSHSVRVVTRMLILVNALVFFFELMGATILAPRHAFGVTPSLIILGALKSKE